MEWSPFLKHYQTHFLESNFTEIYFQLSKDPIKNKPAFIQIMAWRRTGDKPLSEPMMPYLLMQILSPQPQWVNWIWYHKVYPSETLHLILMFILSFPVLDCVLCVVVWPRFMWLFGHLCWGHHWPRNLPEVTWGVLTMRKWKRYFQ